MAESHPMSDYDRIEKVIRHLETIRLEQPSLGQLARFAGLSESHFQRLFSRWAGTTPKDFLKALTAEHARRLLRESKDLLSISHEVGLSGSGRLHDLFVTVEGASPGEFKAKGNGIEIRYGFHETSFGLCLLGVTERGICHLAFCARNNPRSALAELRTKWPLATLKPATRHTAKIAGQIFGLSRKPPLRVLLSGTPFQIKVWEALLRIPLNHLASYGDVAAFLGKRGAARAVGSAVGANSIAYLIPCHRVIRETGVIGDYSWGTERKKAILAWESFKADPK